MAEMHYATPGAGRRIAFQVVIAGIAGVTLITLLQAGQPALLEWVKADPQSARSRAQLLIAGLALLVVAPVVGMAAYMVRIGTRIVREQRFPPEGLAIVRDVIVVRGGAAVRKGRVLQVAATILLLLAALIVLTLWRLATLRPQP